MEGTAVMQQSSVLMTLPENQVQETGAEDTSNEIVPEETVTKDVADETEYSTTQNTHHGSDNLRDKLKILERS